MWNDENIKILDILDNLSNKESIFPVQCPICKKESGHIFMYGDAGCIGSAWVWCSDCYRFSHFQYRIPTWWVNHPSVDLHMLKFEPYYLNNKKADIDKWVNDILSKKKEYFNK